MKEEFQKSPECSRLLDWIVDYLDGKVTEKMRQEIILHVQTCEHCARLLWGMKRIVRYCQMQTDCDVPLLAHQQLWEALICEFETEE
ncbi:hypothetical protein CH330_05810 [candidate division WOR-3 bacterium JGI_Cruoil_03_51_56]|uniref:Putative zinc-finger domain-containing protein n=1 Tax=candidate division WOR-3 bacterium JGI_Cruoil_03_51_56 TaxID=1973747 RepID=A0A235BT90_UNCW3|nr:MAG: hypothetical protein CH330_05810 [candidate division WOR-3 bacterium JGI_Cruoil_03_51_56]